MNVDDIKDWVYENRKGIIVGAIAGFVLSRILK